MPLCCNVEPEIQVLIFFSFPTIFSATKQNTDKLFYFILFFYQKYKTK